jgi:hypothetical protein
MLQERSRVQALSKHLFELIRYLALRLGKQAISSLHFDGPDGSPIEHPALP